MISFRSDVIPHPGKFSLAMTLVALSCLLAISAEVGADDSAATPKPGFTTHPDWEDGLSEMSYYDARDTVYGVERKYTRIHLMNRQWMSRTSGVKCEPKDPKAVAVFKFVISEEIPTENYNYRYLTTVFVTRPTLTPFKMAQSSQEWCGTTFKHLRWSDDGLKVQSFSYFGNEGDQQWTLPGETHAFESLFFHVRAAVADPDRQATGLNVMGSLRSNHAVEPKAFQATLKVAEETKPVRVRAGRFVCKRVSVTGDGHDHWFDVEAEAPYRVIAFSAGGVTGKLITVERRPYWDRQSKSRFYARHKAP